MSARLQYAEGGGHWVYQGDLSPVQKDQFIPVADANNVFGVGFHAKIRASLLYRGYCEMSRIGVKRACVAIWTLSKGTCLIKLPDYDVLHQLLATPPEDVGVTNGRCCCVCLPTLCAHALGAPSVSMHCVGQRLFGSMHSPRACC